MPEGQAEGKHVATRVDFFLADLLRAGELQRAFDPGVRGHGHGGAVAVAAMIVPDFFRQSEISQFHLGQRVTPGKFDEQDVRGLDVPVDETVAGSINERVGDGAQQPERGRRLQGAALRRPRLQITAGAILHDDVERGLRVSDIQHLHDAVVFEPPVLARFVAETPPHPWVGCEVIVNDFQGHFPAGSLVATTHHGAERPAPEQCRAPVGSRQNPIRAKQLGFG